MRFAYFGFPHLGGTHSVFRQLRAGLGRSGIDLRWLAAGDQAHRGLADPAFTAELDHGTLVGNVADPDAVQARKLAEHLITNRYDGVFVNVLADQVQMTLARYLPSNLKRIMIVHNITPGTYAAARAIRDHVHATVGVSRRIRDDLVGRYGFDPERTVVIHNAVEGAPSAERRTRTAPGLRLLYLGRIHDESKGVLWLPKILARLPREVKLTVAGDGPDLPRLRNLSAQLGARVHFVGRVAPERIQDLVAQHDVLVAPSRFEGFMITTVEAMMGGCVPVVSRIRGVTETLVSHGRTGLLFPIGGVAEAAAAVQRLYDDPTLLAAMSEAGTVVARETFSVDRIATDYLDLINRVNRMSAPLPLLPPLPLQRFRIPVRMRGGVRTYLPQPMKAWLRNLREWVS